MLHSLLRLDLHAYEYDPLHANAYIVLPKELNDTHALVNIQNNDDKCFIWCVVAAIYGDEHDRDHERVSHYRQHEHKLNMQGINVPMQLKDIPRFERQNDISTSVYAFEESKMNEDGEKEPGFVYPLKVVNELKEHHVDLLLIGNEETLCLDQELFTFDWRSVQSKQWRVGVLPFLFPRVSWIHHRHSQATSILTRA